MAALSVLQSKTRIAQSIVPVLAGMLVAVLVARDAEGQRFINGMLQAQSGRFIEPPRSVEQQLRDSQRAVEEERFSDAVVRLGDLLARDGQGDADSDLSGQDFFLKLEEIQIGKSVRSSLLREARQMIGRLPSEAIETYELRYGSLARKLLNEAGESRDWDQVRLVRRRYFHTRAGYEASWLLAQNEIYSGHPLAASLLLDDVVSNRRASEQLGVGVHVLYASACHLSGRPVPAIPAGETEIGGRRETIPATDDQSGWLAKHAGRLPSYAPENPTDYAVFGSTPDRNGGSAGQMPLTNLRWMLGTTASPRQERVLLSTADELASAGNLPPPSWIPIRVGNQLLMRTTERLVGVDYRTGKRLWTYPWQSAYEAADDDQFAFDELPDQDNGNDLLNQRVWNDVPYGQVTSDGQRVFMLDDLGEVEMAQFSPMMNLGTRPADTSTNTLVALEMATEGKLLWRLGAGADEGSTLSDAFFLGPPLPVDGRLYVMAEIAGDINLCCLDPATGDELWRQHLVAVESGGIESDPIRRVAGAMPTYQEGVLICPTGAGATVAFDLGDRMLRWGVIYERNTEMIRNINGRGASVDADQLMQRWDNGIAIADGRNVLVTPIEADRLFGFDLLSGESLFPEKLRINMRYLAGIRGNRFFVVGSNQVRAFELDAKGTAVWTARDLLMAGQQISGRGVFGDGNYLLPTTTNQLLQISLNDGSVIDRRSTRYPLGNLVAVDGEVVAQSPTSLAVAFGEASLEPIVKRMLEENPDDFEALVRKSELLIQKDQRREALGFLERARQMQPDNDEVQMLSVSAMLGLMRENADMDSALIDSLEQLIDRPAQRAELLALRIRAAIDSGEHIEAIRRLIDFSSLLDSETLMQSISEQIVNDPSRHCSLDSWLAARVKSVGDVADDQQREEINRMLGELAEKRIDESTNSLQQLYGHFRFFAGLDPIRDELAKRFAKAGESLRLERMALGAQIPTDTTPLPTNDVDWPKPISLDWESRQIRTRFGGDEQRVSKTEVLAGEKFKGWQLISDSTNPLALRDPFGATRSIPVEGLRQSEDVDKQAQISGGAMLVLTPSSLICVDLFHLLAGDGEAVLWQRNLSSDGAPIANRLGESTPFGDQVVHRYIKSAVSSNVIPELTMGPVLGDRFLMLQGGELLAIDLISKETLWRNSTAPISGVVVSDGQQVAVVSPKTAEIALFDVHDGRKLETRPWKYGQVWESIGRHVLSYQPLENRQRYELTVVDPFADEVQLKETVHSTNRSGLDGVSTYGRVVDGRYLVTMESTGATMIWDLVDAREIGRPKLTSFDDLDGLHAMVMDDQMLILPKRRIDRSRQPSVEQLQTADGSSHQTVHGVFAVSINDGTLRWNREFDKPWGCTLTQAPGTPILLLTRSPFTYSLQSRKKYLDVVALDIADGSELVLREGRPILPSNNDLEVRLTVQAVLSRVIAHIGTEMLTFKFGQPSDVETEQSTETSNSESAEYERSLDPED